jgi:hypothetical protein
MNDEYSGPDLGLATGEPDVTTFYFGAPFLSPPLSLSPSLSPPPPAFIVDVDYRLCITWILHQQLWGYKVDQKLRPGVRGKKRWIPLR